MPSHTSSDLTCTTPPRRYVLYKCLAPVTRAKQGPPISNRCTWATYPSCSLALRTATKAKRGVVGHVDTAVKVSKPCIMFTMHAHSCQSHNADITPKHLLTASRKLVL